MYVLLLGAQIPITLRESLKLFGPLILSNPRKGENNGFWCELCRTGYFYSKLLPSQICVNTKKKWPKKERFISTNWT